MKFLGMGTLEILAILIIALIVLGPDRMIKSARRMGEGIRELKKAMWKAEQYLEEDPIGSPSNLITDSNEKSVASKDSPISTDTQTSDEIEKTPPSS